MPGSLNADRLHYFSVVARTGNLRRASELLRLSPAALSKSIKLLEEELGLKLIIPAGRGIVISEAESDSPAVPRRSSNNSINCGPLHQDSAEKLRILRVGSFEVFTTYFMGPLIRDHLRPYSLVLHEFVPGNLEQALNRGEIDLGITYLPIPSPTLDHLRVAAVEMGIYARKGAFAGQRFDELPFAVPVDPIHGSPTKVQGLDGWPDDRIRRSIQYRVTLMESAMELCRQGLAAAYLPKFVVDLHNRQVRDEFQLSARPLPRELKSAEQAVYLVKRKSDPEDDTIRKLARALRRLAL